MLVLEICGLCMVDVVGVEWLCGIDLDICVGEIVGIVGVLGNG